MDQGFADLRANQGSGNISDTFWPSFTDIMTVVVMIFMIVSTVLILRHWELVAELRATIEAEHKASEMARSATETSETLEEQLAQAQYTISELRMQLMRSREANQLQMQMLGERDRRITGLQQQTTGLEERLEQAQGQSEELRLALETKNQEVLALTRIREKQEKTLKSQRNELASLRTDSIRQKDELNELRSRHAAGARQLAVLQGEFDTLKREYDKLVRPARSAKGKQVVEVRYEKLDGHNAVRLKEPGSALFETIGKRELHSRLSVLKRSFPRQLYVKIIIPEQSGLSYNEAWSFTRELLDKYDYYYQE